MRRFVALTFLFGICIVPTLAEDLVNVNGKVTLDKGSAIPKRAALAFGKFKAVCQNDNDPRTENWVVDKQSLGIRDVMVHIVSEPTDDQAKLIAKDKARAKVELGFDPKKLPEKFKAVPKDPVVFDQPCCRYIPHVAFARVGQTVEIKNNSATPHQFSWLSNNNGEPSVLLNLGQGIKIRDLEPERNVIALNCATHPWMKAYLKVVDTPYFATTNDKGEFVIKDIPPGKYRIIYFHPEAGFLGGAMGRFGKEIEIKPKGGELPPVEFKSE